MINPDIYGKKILDALLNTSDLKDEGYVDDSAYVGKKDPNKRNRVTFGQNVYIGLLTKLPTPTDIDAWAEPTAPEYVRFKLSRKSPITGNPILKSAITDTAIDVKTKVEPESGGEATNVVDQVYAAYVTNDDNIIFPEVSSNLEAWGGGHIAGFGLFSDVKGGKPFFWGEVKPDNSSGTSTVSEEEEETGVDIQQEEVPIIRIGSFKVTVT